MPSLASAGNEVDGLDYVAGKRTLSPLLNYGNPDFVCSRS